MTSSGTTTICAHPVRDIIIVMLVGVVAGLLSFIVVTELGGTALDGLTKAGTACLAVTGAGLIVLQYLKRN
ncbi:hypothetical protein [Streptomyces sp. NPDC058650]|uniref:hypothetical protein n=1 Tax=unclassified Streptomyces TaxID=2593676 RepID=UPI0036685461|nr:hypothetical protein OG462_07885 [Streptomyces sp. NBC_01077]